MYVFIHLGRTVWLMILPIEEVVKVHHLFFTGIQVTIATGLFCLNRHKLTTVMLFNGRTSIQLNMARAR